jgi:hypothetical protein
VQVIGSEIATGIIFLNTFFGLSHITTQRSQNDSSKPLHQNHFLNGNPNVNREKLPSIEWKLYFQKGDVHALCGWCSLREGHAGTGPRHLRIPLPLLYCQSGISAGANFE